MGKALGLTPVGIHGSLQNLHGFRSEKRIQLRSRTTSSQVKTNMEPEARRSWPKVTVREDRSRT